MDTLLTGAGRTAPCGPAGMAAALGTHHLVHRPVATGARSASGEVEHSFVLSAELPRTHPLFNDSPGDRHDLSFAVEAMRGVAVFVAYRYFDLPEGSHVAFASAEMEVTDPRPWRRTDRPAHAALDIRVRTVDVTDGVPAGLVCEAVGRIDDVPCCAGRAWLVCLPGEVYRERRARGRAESMSGGHRWPDGVRGARLLSPELVGRTDGRNVLVTEPLSRGEGSVVVDVTPDPTDQVFFGPGTEYVPGIVLVEASRQAAVLAAGTLHGLCATHCVTTRWSGVFRGFAEVDLPMRCTVSTGGPTRDARDQLVVPVTIALCQGGRSVGTVAVSVLQDC